MSYQQPLQTIEPDEPAAPVRGTISSGTPQAARQPVVLTPTAPSGAAPGDLESGTHSSCNQCPQRKADHHHSPQAWEVFFGKYAPIEHNGPCARPQRSHLYAGERSRLILWHCSASTYSGYLRLQYTSYAVCLPITMFSRSVAPCLHL